MGYACEVHLHVGQMLDIKKKKKSGSLCHFVHKIVVMDIIESDHMPVELYYKFYTDPYSCVGEKSQEKNEKVFWREDKVYDFKQCII